MPEPAFSQIEQGRGFRHSLLRGKDKVRSERQFICTGDNVLQLFRALTTGLTKTSRCVQALAP